MSKSQSELWEKVSEILNDVLDADPSRREALLEEACGGDESLRREVERFLAVEKSAEEFLSDPLFSLREEELTPGIRIGVWKIERLLGRGGMGQVYLVRRAVGEFEQRAALKVLRRGFDSEELLQRFRVERQILARLEHPNIARLLDGGNLEDGRPYLVMEYVEGQPIHAWCDEQSLGVRQRIEMFRTVCAAVSEAHRHLIVHRDLKPGNILVDGEGRIKLLDFGVAKLIRPDVSPQAEDSPPVQLSASKFPLSDVLADLQSMQTLGSAALTPSYASPEQYRRETVTTATDVYALGALLYLLLTGRHPLDLEDLTFEEARAVVEQRAPEPPSRAPLEFGASTREFSKDLDAIVLRALQKDPKDRFTSVEQFSEDLRRYLEGFPVDSRNGGFVDQAVKLVRRQSGRFVAAAASIVLISVVGVTSWQGRAQEQRLARLGTEVENARDVSTAVTGVFVEVLEARDPSSTGGRVLSIEEAFEVAVGSLKDDFYDKPALRATLLDAVGNVYADLGQWGEAAVFLEEALALRRQVFGSQHPLVAESLHNLAGSVRRLGERSRAETMMREAIKIQQAVFPDGHRDLARGLHNLANHLRRRGELPEAERYAREALEMKLKLYGPDDPEVASTLSILGTIVKKANPEDAEKLYRRAIEIRRMDPEGAVSTSLASSLGTLAVLLQEQERFEESLEIHSEVIRLRRRLHGGDHHRLAVALHNAAYAYMKAGQYEISEEHYEESIAMELRLEEPQFVDVAKFRKNYAELCMMIQEFALCEELAALALPVLEAEGETRRAEEALSLREQCEAQQVKESGREALAPAS